MGKQTYRVGKSYLSIRKTLILLVSLWVFIRAISADASIHQEDSCYLPNQNKEQYQYSFRYPFRLSSRKLNKEVHARYGNQVNRGKQIPICYWNKGLSYLINKKEDIKQIIYRYKPMVLGLGEAQVEPNHDLTDIQQPGFTLHLDGCQASLGVSRCAVYTQKKV